MRTMKLTIDGTPFTLELNESKTVDDIWDMLPLTLMLQHYADHEYYASLPSVPTIKDVPMTSSAHAQGVYYYDGWTAFTILYGGAEISPFEVVHIGDIKEDVTAFLKSKGGTVNAVIEQG